MCMYIHALGDDMANVTLRVPDDLKARLEHHKEVNWSEVARHAMADHLYKIELLEKIAAKSRLTERDVEEIGHKIKREIAKRHGIK